MQRVLQKIELFSQHKITKKHPQEEEHLVTIILEFVNNNNLVNSEINCKFSL